MTEARLRKPKEPRKPWPTRSPGLPTAARFLPVFLSILASAACAPNPADAQSSTPARVTQVRQICADTMHLNPTEADHEACVGSLLQTLAGLDEARLVQSDRTACLNQGLQPGTREFALCVVDREQLATSN